MNTKNYKPVYFIQNLDDLTARLSYSRVCAKQEKVVREFKSELDANNCLAQFNSYKRITTSILQNLEFYDKAFSFPQKHSAIECAELTIYREGIKIAGPVFLAKLQFEPFVMKYYESSFRIYTELRVEDGYNYIDVYFIK